MKHREQQRSRKKCLRSRCWLGEGRSDGRQPETDDTLGRIYPGSRDNRNLLGAPPRPCCVRVVVRAGKWRAVSWDELKQLVVTDSYSSYVPCAKAGLGTGFEI